MVAYFEAHGARKCGAEENTAEYGKTNFLNFIDPISD